jgi:hypothetical protein
MVNQIFMELGECELCKNKADGVYIITSWFSFNVRTYCKSCAKLFSRIRNDIKANHK